jgi:hypothetical protein
MRRILLLLGSMALVGALSAGLFLISGLGQQAAEAQTTPPSSATLMAWGYNGQGQTNVPDAALNGATAIDAGWFHSLALKDGGVVAWGDTRFGQLNNFPEGLSGVTAISAGALHSLALKGDGTVVAWGNSDYGEGSVPDAAQSGVTAIAAGAVHNLALKDGGVVAWGNNSYGQLNVPDAAKSGVTAISTDGYHNLALKDGGVIAWGNRYDENSNFPDAALSGVTAISAGYYDNLALKDGGVIAWGATATQSSVPDAAKSGVTAISAGFLHSLALKGDGTIVAWGNNGDGQLNVPDAAQSGVTAIAAGRGHTLALVVPDTTAPTVPTGVSATAVASPVVTWTPSTDSVGVTKYNIKRSTTLDGTYTTVGSVTGSPPTASFTDSTAEPSTTYYYKVNAEDAATNASADSSESSPITTPATSDTTAPTLISTSPSAPNGTIGTMLNRSDNVTATFSEDVKNVNATTFKLEQVTVSKKGVETTSPVAATVAPASGTVAQGASATLDPSKVLQRGSTYRATLTNGVTDMTGNALGAPYTWTFKVSR